MRHNAVKQKRNEIESHRENLVKQQKGCISKAKQLRENLKNIEAHHEDVVNRFIQAERNKLNQTRANYAKAIADHELEAQALDNEIAAANKSITDLTAQMLQA